MAEASSLAAAPEGTRSLRLTWVDDPDGLASYVGYIGPSSAVSPEAQFGFAGPGVQFMVAPNLVPGTAYRLWLVAVDALGLGPTIGPVTASTAEVPAGSLNIAALRDALVAFVKSALPTGRAVEWRYEDGAKPGKAFVELHLVGPLKPGQDYEASDHVEGLRRFRLTVRCFADKQKVAMQDAVDVQSATDRSDLLAALQAAGYSFGEVGEVTDTTGLLDSKWEARHEFEAQVHAVSVTAVETGQIDVVNLSNGLNP